MSRVSFHRAKVQNLLLPDQSVDQLVCHMAFMLMLPVEPVVQEISRVLKTKGRFTAVIGGRSSAGLYAELQKANFQWIQARYPRVQEVKAGAPGVGSVEGLKELFSTRLGFGSIQAFGSLGFPMRSFTVVKDA